MEPPIGTTRMIFTGSGNMGPRTMVLGFRSCGFIVGRLFAPSGLWLLAAGDCVSGSTASDPCIHLRQFALPQTTDAMRRQPFVLNPTVDSVDRHSKMGSDLVHREP